MPELRELQRRVESIHGLREVVNAMRNLAAVYVRRAESTLRAIRPPRAPSDASRGFAVTSRSLDLCRIPRDVHSLRHG